MGNVGQKQYYLDPETELYLLGSGTNGRYYDANTARFMSEDPIRQSAGDPNLLSYVENNPVNRIDPSGADDTQTQKQPDTSAQPSSSAPSAAPGTPSNPSAAQPSSTDKVTAPGTSTPGNGNRIRFPFPARIDSRSLRERVPRRLRRFAAVSIDAKKKELMGVASCEEAQAGGE